MAQHKPYKSRKPQIIQEILVEMNAHATYTQIFAAHRDEWHIGRRTFDRYVQEAQILHKEQIQQVNDAIIAARTEHEKELLKKAIVSKEEVLVKLLHIANKAKRDADKTNALRLICEIQGYKAPIQQHIEVENVTPIFWENPLTMALDTTTIDITHTEELPEPPPDQDTDTDTPPDQDNDDI